VNSIQQQIHITADWIRLYAQSIEAPMQTLHGDLIAPATMPIVFWQVFDIPWLKLNNVVPYIHGTQQFTYEKPIIAGMILDCQLSLLKVEEKVSRKGILTLYYYELVCHCETNLIVTAETVLIQVGDHNEKTYSY